MRIDAHVNFWDPARRTYPWMDADMDPVRRRFGPGDLRPLLSAARFDSCVVAQTVPSTAETAELLAAAAASGIVAGVVGWVDLTDRRAASAIADLRAAPGGARLVGLRHPVHDEADPEWLLRPDVERGLTAVEEAGLVYDLMVRTRELPAAVEAARRHPHLTFVLDHGARPRIAAGERDRDWEDAMAPLADLPNLACKLSGLVAESDWNSWRPERIAPYVDLVMSWFGAERCMFGSDWPSCLLAAPYASVVSAIRDVIAEDDDVFGGTAARVYRLR